MNALQLSQMMVNNELGYVPEDDASFVATQYIALVTAIKEHAGALTQEALDDFIAVIELDPARG